MEESLVAYAPAILAVALAVTLRLLRNHRETSKEVAALRIELTALRDRNRKLEQDLRQARERVTTRSLHEDPEYARPLTSFADRAQIDEAFHQLQAMKTILPPDTTVEEKYIAELDSIVERLEQATGMDLSRWLGVPPSEGHSASTFPGSEHRASKTGVRRCNRSLFRFKILSLQAFCNYQIYHSQRIAASPRVARRVH